MRRRTPKEGKQRNVGCEKRERKRRREREKRDGGWMGAKTRARIGGSVNHGE